MFQIWRGGRGCRRYVSQVSNTQTYSTFLRSVFSLNFFWCSQAEGCACVSVCVCENVFVCVCAGSSLAWNSGALALSFPGPRCSQADKLCHALICHTGCYLSLSPSRLPLDMLSLQHWGYYSCHWRRKRGISLFCSREATACHSSSCRWTKD